jgi:hypothetical protein
MITHKLLKYGAVKYYKNINKCWIKYFVLESTLLTWRLFEFRSSYASDFMTDANTSTEPKKNRYNNVIFKALSAVN